MSACTRIGGAARSVSADLQVGPAGPRLGQRAAEGQRYERGSNAGSSNTDAATSVGMVTAETSPIDRSGG